MKTRQELAAAWKARCQSGTFSKEVKGMSFIGVMGRSGDQQITFPRISSLAVLNTLEEDERWAVEEAQRIFNEKRGNGSQTRQVFGQSGAGLGEKLEEFNPDFDRLLIGNMIAGG